ncbi:MAG: hypothetical protein KDB11_33775 [Planctomycetales bacterium]|nr:hypothetical protein [Planctomycetales bacterium]
MTIDPTVYAATIIATVVATLIANRLLDWMRHRDKMIGLERTNAALQSENTTAKQQILDLQKDVHDVTERLRKYESGESILAKYEFEPTTGLYRLGDLHYCPCCLFKSPPVEAPMYDQGDGIACRLCPHFYKKEA